MSLARNVLEQIIQRRRGDARLARASSRRTSPPELAQALALDSAGGVLIRGIVRNGPAERAGIQVRDVVLEIDGKPTRDTPALLARIAELPPGQRRSR